MGAERSKKDISRVLNQPFPGTFTFFGIHGIPAICCVTYRGLKGLKTKTGFIFFFNLKLGSNTLVCI